MTRWVSEGRVGVYRLPGDRRRWVDLDEVKKYRRPQLIKPRREDEPES